MKKTVLTAICALILSCCCGRLFASEPADSDTGPVTGGSSASNTGGSNGDTPGTGTPVPTADPK